MTSEMQIIGLQFLLYLIQFWMNFYDILESIEKTFSQRFCFLPKTYQNKTFEIFSKTSIIFLLTL